MSTILNIYGVKTVLIENNKNNIIKNKPRDVFVDVSLYAQICVHIWTYCTKFWSAIKIKREFAQNKTHQTEDRE